MARQPNLIFDIGLHKGEDTDFFSKRSSTSSHSEQIPTSLPFAELASNSRSATVG
jgi:hypothetical protein